MEENSSVEEATQILSSRSFSTKGYKSVSKVIIENVTLNLSSAPPELLNTLLVLTLWYMYFTFRHLTVQILRSQTLYSYFQKHNIQCNLCCVIPFAKNMIYLYVQVTQVERWMWKCSICFFYSIVLRTLGIQLQGIL